MIDCDLMTQTIDKTLSQMRPKRQAILRTKLHYCVKELINQFKTHVWGIVETHCGAIFHACDYLLGNLDSAQRHFLNEVGVTEAEAFKEYNFAPPKFRRAIGVLGFLHKRVLGKSHPDIQKLLPFHFDVFGSLRPGEHDKQLYGHIMDVQQQHSLHSRSIFGMAYLLSLLHI